MTSADRAAAYAALRRLWPLVPEPDRPIIKLLGEHLHELVMGKQEPTPRQNPGRVRRDEARADAFDRKMEQAGRDQAPPEVGREALAKLRGGG